MNRRPVMRLLLASAAIAAAVALGGCDTEGVAPTLRSLQPLSPQMIAAIERKNMSKESPILVRIFKEKSELEVWKEDNTGRMALLKTYPICRWSGDLGPKIKEGDRQAPEGFYTITPSLMNPNSSYYLSINLGYPNAYDRAHNRTGAFLMIHGDCSSRGCYAMTDEQMAEIYALARESFFGGQGSFQIQAFPFRMTPQNMARHRNSQHMAFWRMLKVGYDHFEVTRQEPKVDVCDRRYVFNTEFERPLQFDRALPGDDDAARSRGVGEGEAAPRRSTGGRPDPPRRPGTGSAQLRRRRHASDLPRRGEALQCRRRRGRCREDRRRRTGPSRPISASRPNVRRAPARPPHRGPRPAASPSRWSASKARRRQPKRRRHSHRPAARRRLLPQRVVLGRTDGRPGRIEHQPRRRRRQRQRPSPRRRSRRPQRRDRNPPTTRSKPPSRPPMPARSVRIPRKRMRLRSSRRRNPAACSVARSRQCRPAASTIASAPGAKSVIRHQRSGIRCLLMPDTVA